MAEHQITEQERSVLAAGALVTDLEDAPRALVTLTDEEVLALHGEDSPDLQLPAFSVLQGREEGLARADGVLLGSRSLQARGMIAPEGVLAKLEERTVIGDPRAFRASLILTGIVARRALFRRRISIADEVSEGSPVFEFSVDVDGTVLQEQISPAGLHHFLVHPAPSAARALASFVTPEGRSDEQTEEETTPRTGTWSDLRHELDVSSGSVVRRIVVRDRGAAGEEVLWWMGTAKGGFLLRAQDPGLPGLADEMILDVVPLTEHDERELVEDLLRTPGSPG